MMVIVNLYKTNPIKTMLCIKSTVDKPGKILLGLGIGPRAEFGAGDR